MRPQHFPYRPLGYTRHSLNKAKKLSYDQLADRLNVSKGSIGALRARSLGRLQEQIARLNTVD